MGVQRIQEFTYVDLKIGQVATFRHTLRREHLEGFARLSGDINPLHLDDDFAKKQGFPSALAQGLLVQSLFSQLAGVHLPGKHALILSVETNFRKPVLPEQELIIEGTIKNKTDALKIITLETSVRSIDGETLISGIMKVKVLR